MSGHIGIFGKDVNVTYELYWALYALQHRGEVASGIAVLDDEKSDLVSGLGLVGDIFSEEEINRLNGAKGVAHVKYAFHDDLDNLIVYPLIYDDLGYPEILSVDGSFIEKEVNQNDVIKIFRDSDNITKNLPSIKGAYSIVYLTPEKMVVARDPWGIKNMVIGRYGSNYVVASETCAIESIGAEILRELVAGEIVTIDENGLRSELTETRVEKNCIFEFVYTARQDSYINGLSVYESRYNMGRRLAEEAPVNADVVIGAPDSGTIAALGYSHESRIQYKEGILKNRYVGRTFTLPEQSMRERAVKIKLNPLRRNLDGKRVILVDDSIVRGTTIRNTVAMLRNAGAAEVHVRIAAPPVVYSCNLCVDTPSRDNLIGANKTIEETREIIGADSLAYLSIDSLIRCCGGQNIYCKHCFDGNYPINLENIEVKNGDNL